MMEQNDDTFKTLKLGAQQQHRLDEDGE